MDDGSRRDFLWKVLARIDFYINTTNTKAAFILSVNSLLFGLLALNGEQLLADFHHRGLHVTMAVVLAVLGALLILSLGFAISVIAPFLDSGSRTNKYHSKIFFGSIAKFEEVDYLGAVKNLIEKDADEDLARQIYVVAKGADGKFARLQTASRLLLWGSIPLILFFMFVKFISAIF